MLEIFDAEGRLIEGVTKLIDVSATGARFRSTLKFSRDQVIRARLRLLKAGVLDIVGHIVWVEGKANFTVYGLAFDSTKPVA